MKELDIRVPVCSMGYDELDDDTRRLVDTAREYTHHSYAPYSHFSVGAAIRLDNGEIVPGANQENAAYPSGTCAGSEIRQPVAPCGACRQALLEYEKLAGHDVEVYLVGSECIYRIPSVKALLPLAFSDFE